MAQLVARDVWDVDAAGSNPVTPTKIGSDGEYLSLPRKTKYGGIAQLVRVLA